MSVLHLAMTATLFVVLPAVAQYPQRGQPDPSFHGGQARVLAVTPDPGGWDEGRAIAKLTGTRFAVLVVRFQQATDAVVIVDTLPEQVTTFELPLRAGAGFEYAYEIAGVGNAVLIGGYRSVSSTRSDATLALREIGTAANPTFVLAGEYVAQPPDDFPQGRTSGIAARLGSGGRVEAWHGRTAANANGTCSVAEVQRLDAVASLLVQRHRVDLSAALGLSCMAIDRIALASQRPGDPLGAQAMIAGGRCKDHPSDAEHYACATRVLDTGAALAVDMGYGINGLAQYRGPAGARLTNLSFAVDPLGSVWFAGSRSTTPGSSKGFVFRFGPGGLFDSGFGDAGVLLLPTGAANQSWAYDIALTPDGLVQVAGRAANASGIVRPVMVYYDAATTASQVARLEIGDINSSAYLALVTLPAAGALAVGNVYSSDTTGHTLIARLAGDRQTQDLLEYFHAGFGHYFLTGIADEIRKLDDSIIPGWQRTGQGFAVLPVGAGGAFDVCRFFSASFAPRSSHFYTPLVSECDGLRAGNTWTYEGLVFALRTPSPASTCPAGTSPLFRSYNNGMSGAPNHRYMVSEAVRANQAAQGWIGEGSGVPPVFACVPR